MLPLRFVYAKMDAFAIQSNRVLNSQRVFKGQITFHHAYQKFQHLKLPGLLRW